MIVGPASGIMTAILLLASYVKGTTGIGYATCAGNACRDLRLSTCCHVNAGGILLRFAGKKMQ